MVIWDLLTFAKVHTIYGSLCNGSLSHKRSTESLRLFSLECDASAKASEDSGDGWSREAGGGARGGKS